MIGQPPAARRDHVLIPIGATTNGRLHLGHIGGPMLKLDVMARHLRRAGDHATVVSTTDPHDSFVLLRGRETGQSPTEVVEHWHPLIERDLNAAGIVPDRFVNLLDEPWRTRFDDICRAIVADLTAQGLVTTVRERFPYCAATDEYVTGGFLRGECPDCATATAGYFCENCGQLFRPETVGSARCGLDGCTPDWREVPCLYVRLPRPEAVLRRMTTMGVPEEFHRIVATYLRRNGPLLRLSQPGTWGVPVPVQGSPVPQVVFTYVVCGLAFLMLCTQMGVETLPNRSDGAAPHTVTAFGFDNSLPFLLGGLGIPMALPGYRPLDHMLLNHFMTLEGSKFSTSRGHVIWAGDLAGTPGVGSDPIRAYLVRQSPHRTSTDFSRAAFVDFCETELRGRWRHAVDRAWRAGPGTHALPERLAEQLNGLLAVQERALDPTDQDPPAVVTAIQSWVDDAAQTADPAWWLRGLGLLADPVLPEFASQLWRSLGMTGDPLVERFTDPAPGPWAPAPPIVGEASCVTR